MVSRGEAVKKLRLQIVGALLLSSIPVQMVFAVKKRKIYECHSDKKILAQTVSEYTAVVRDIAGVNAQFMAKRNYLVHNNEIKTEVLFNGDAQLENTGKYLTIQTIEWTLAIAPEKKRASLYSSNPDMNEIPMFCLSPSAN